jgi:hypothetical protein
MAPPSSLAACFTKSKWKQIPVTTLDKILVKFRQLALSIPYELASTKSTCEGSKTQRGSAPGEPIPHTQLLHELSPSRTIKIGVNRSMPHRVSKGVTGKPELALSGLQQPAGHWSSNG